MQIGITAPRGSLANEVLPLRLIMYVPFPFHVILCLTNEFIPLMLSFVITSKTVPLYGFSRKWFLIPVHVIFLAVF